MQVTTETLMLTHAGQSDEALRALHARGGRLLLTVLGMLACMGAWAAEARRPPDLTLRGSIEASEHQSYRQVPFEVPVGVTRIEVRFDYTGREARTTIDLGLLGPGTTFAEAFRGWSGGNKQSFELARGTATPSYLAGPVTPGAWNLLLGIPNIRVGQKAQFTAEIFFDRGAAAPDPAPLNPQPGWYRGDLHLHSGHSDGSCNNKSGTRRVPCPLFLTLDVAAERGLDFIAITEHNTNSHVRELTALQPYFDRLLLIPGMELTTFQGHANAFNVTEAVDFRVGSASVPDWNALLTSLAARNALVSINHPRLPSGEICMGCGWVPTSPLDMARLQAVEVVSGADVETSRSGLPFWHEQLQQGHRLTAIGGSDTHNVTAAVELIPTGRLGIPTTVVRSDALGVRAILDAIRAGAVFIDVAGTRDRQLDLTAERNGAERNGAGRSGPVVPMGGELELAIGVQAVVRVQVANLPGGSIEIIRDGTVLTGVAASRIETADYAMQFTELGDGQRHWIRANARDRDGKLALIGNPIYVNWRTRR